MLYLKKKQTNIGFLMLSIAAAPSEPALLTQSLVRSVVFSASS